MDTRVPSVRIYPLASALVEDLATWQATLRDFPDQADLEPTLSDCARPGCRNKHAPASPCTVSHRFPYLEFRAASSQRSQSLLAVFTRGFSVQAILEYCGLLKILCRSGPGAVNDSHHQHGNVPKLRSLLRSDESLLMAEAVEKVPRTRILETMVQKPGRD